MNLKHLKPSRTTNPMHTERGEHGRSTWLAGVALAALATTTLLPAAATADEASWYYQELGYNQLHEQGIDGEGVTIAIFETGVDLNAPDLQGADVEMIPLPDECLPIREHAAQNNLVDLDGGTYQDSIAHGTQVATMIVGQGGAGRIQGVAPKAKLLVMEVPFSAITPSSSVWPEACDSSKVLSGGRFKDAEDRGADIFSLSILGPIQPGPYLSTYLQMRGKALITGAGNDKTVTAESAGAPGIVTVTAVAPGNTVTDWAASGSENTVAAPGQNLTLREHDGSITQNGAGTSYAAPIVAGMLALGHQKWPDATYKQLVHSLTQTASNKGTHSNDLGYGTIDPVAFINNDPAQYPDEPILYPESELADPEWDVVRDLCTGFPLDETMGYISHYRADYGIDPNYVEWLPQKAKDEGWLGTGDDPDHWQKIGAKDSESTDEATGNNTTGSSASPAETLLRTVVLIAILAAIALGIWKLFGSRKKTRSNPADNNPGGHPGNPTSPGQNPPGSKQAGPNPPGPRQ